jgi:hypothetical protein
MINSLANVPYLTTGQMIEVDRAMIEDYHIELVQMMAMKPILIFVYNADSSLFNSLTDFAHKIFSPQTYQCNLCAITYSASGMKKEWREFLDHFDMPMEFLHRDELKERYDTEGVPLPAIFKKNGNELETWIDAEAINACRSIDDLKQLMMSKLSY